MRFGKPALTTEPEVADDPEPVEIVRVKASVSGDREWTWEFRGESRRDNGLALLNKLTGEPDEHGWIRDTNGDWAYRADEIRSVTLRYATETPKAAA